DFWSFGTMFGELSRLYTQGAVLPSSGDYSEFVRWESELLDSPRGEQLRSFWERELAGSGAPLNLPFDKTRPAMQSFRGDSIEVSIGEHLLERIRGVSQEEGATLFMTLLAAFQTLLHRYTGQNEVPVGVPTSGRSRAEFAGTVGYFVNPVVIRGATAGDMTF